MNNLFTQKKDDKSDNDSDNLRKTELDPLDSFNYILGLDSSNSSTVKNNDKENVLNLSPFTPGSGLEKSLKEIKIDAQPMNLNEITPQSSIESDRRKMASKNRGDLSSVNYSNLESETFKKYNYYEMSDSSTEFNASSEKNVDADSKTDSEQHEYKDNQFSKFYDNLYSTEDHGDTVVGAFILKNEKSESKFLFSYPPVINVNKLGSNEGLKAEFSPESYTCKRDVISELQSCLHLIPGLAFGSMNNETLVDFVHFTLPTKSGNVLFGISYVMQLSEESEPEVDSYNEPERDEEVDSKGSDVQEAEQDLIKVQTGDCPSTDPKDPLSEDLLHLDEPDLPASSGAPKPERSTAPAKPSEVKRRFTPKKPLNLEFVSICLVVKVPFFGLLGSRLEYVAQTYFDIKNFDDPSLLVSFLDHINKNDKVEDWNYESLFFNLEYHFKPFSLCLSYRALLFILKSILTEQKIMIYSECAARSSTCVLSLLTMIPCANSLNFNSNAFGSLWFNWKKYGFPLDLFRSDNPIYPYFSESMSSLLDKASGYFIGVTDLGLVKKLKNPPGLIFDMEEEVIKLKTRELLGFYSPSFYEISFFDDFEFLDELELDDEPLKMVVDTSENIFHFVGDYLSKAPSAFIELSGKASKIYHLGRRLGSRRHRESYLRLFDIYFPGALPKFLRFSKKPTKEKKPEPPPSETTDSNDQENDEVGTSEKNSDAKKGKKRDPTVIRRAKWDDVISTSKDSLKVDSPTEDYSEGSCYNESVFSFSKMFSKMLRRSMKYKYLGYIENLHSEEVIDRNKEIEYAIFTRIQPLRDFLLKFLNSFAYAGGKGRRSYHLVMDFLFDLDSVIDFNNPVEGVYIVRGEKYLRGTMEELPDFDEDLPPMDEYQKKSYLMEGDVEVKLKLPSMLATYILEIQNNHSIDFIELWIQTNNFKQFYTNHNLEVFNEPVFYLSQNVAKYTYPNGDFYVGELVDMLRDGKGSYVSKDGSRYDGGWMRDKRHGKGTLITDEVKYTGDWFNDKKHGFGRLETKNSTYVGDFRHNRLHGNVSYPPNNFFKGTLTYKNGVKQKGEFKSGRFEGKGVMTLPDGSVRMGNFKNGVVTGVCSVIDKNGKVFVGELHGDLFHGKGIMKYNKHTSFEGFWTKGKRVKQGTISTLLSGLPLKVEGVWEDDSMLMNDVLVSFPNSFKYNGKLRHFPLRTLTKELLNDDSDFRLCSPDIDEEDLDDFVDQFNKLDNRTLPHGHGICKDTNGGVYNGTFFYGSKHGNTSQVFPNGVIYTGEYYLGKLHGLATVQMSSKRTIEVKFNKGRLETHLDIQDESELQQCLNLEYPLFVSEFVKYKLDSLIDVMQCSTTLGMVDTDDSLLN